MEACHHCYYYHHPHQHGCHELGRVSPVVGAWAAESVPQLVHSSPCIFALAWEVNGMLLVTLHSETQRLQKEAEVEIAVVIVVMWGRIYVEG